MIEQQEQEAAKAAEPQDVVVDVQLDDDSQVEAAEKPKGKGGKKYVNKSKAAAIPLKSLDAEGENLALEREIARQLLEKKNAGRSKSRSSGNKGKAASGGKKGRKKAVAADPVPQKGLMGWLGSIFGKRNK